MIVMNMIIMIILSGEKSQYIMSVRTVSQFQENSKERTCQSHVLGRQSRYLHTCSNSPEKGKSKFLLNVVCTKFLCCDAMVKSIDRTLCVLVFL